jgi:hypothetical protein
MAEGYEEIKRDNRRHLSAIAAFCDMIKYWLLAIKLLTAIGMSAPEIA